MFAWRVADESRPAARSLLICHGAGEHSQRYLRIARRAARDGWQVVGFDFRGHGCSDGLPVHVRSFRDYVEDVARVAGHFGLEPARTAVLAHSMGGLVTVTAHQQGVFPAAATALSAPLLRLEANVPLWKLAAGRVVKRAWPATRFRTSVAIEDLLADPAAVAERRRDPLMCRSLTAGWYFSAMTAVTKAWRLPPPADTLIMQGTADRVVSPDAPAEWRDRDGATEVWTLPGQRHELLHEPSGVDLANEAIGWLGDRVSRVFSAPLRDAA